MLFSLIYLTLVTSCLNGPFLCLSLLYLIICLVLLNDFEPKESSKQLKLRVKSLLKFCRVLFKVTFFVVKLCNMMDKCRDTIRRNWGQDDHAKVKPYRNRTYRNVQEQRILQENIFYILEKLNFFVRHCSLSLSLFFFFNKPQTRTLTINFSFICTKKCLINI